MVFLCFSQILVAALAHPSSTMAHAAVAALSRRVVAVYAAARPDAELGDEYTPAPIPPPPPPSPLLTTTSSEDNVDHAVVPPPSPFALPAGHTGLTPTAATAATALTAPTAAVATADVAALVAGGAVAALLTAMTTHCNDVRLVIVPALRILAALATDPLHRAVCLA